MNTLLQIHEDNIKVLMDAGISYDKACKASRDLMNRGIKLKQENFTFPGPAENPKSGYQLTDKIEVPLNGDVFKDSEFTNPLKCPIRRTLERLYPDSMIKIYFEEVDIDGKLYKMSASEFSEAMYTNELYNRDVEKANLSKFSKGHHIRTIFLNHYRF